MWLSKARHRRLELGFSQATLARRCKVSRSTIHRFENGCKGFDQKTVAVSAKTAAALARNLRKPMDYFCSIDKLGRLIAKEYDG